MDNAQIELFMKNLDISREEAIELLMEDEKIDGMTVKEAESDLTPEQKQAIKKAKSGARSAVNAYGKKVKVTEKVDLAKEAIITEIANFLTRRNDLVTSCEVTNKSREISFKADGDSYTLTLVRHRPKKKK